MKKLISLSLLIGFALAPLTQAQAQGEPQAQVFLGAAPYFVAAQPPYQEYNGADDCEVHVEVSRDFLFRKVLNFTATALQFPEMVTEANAPPVLESDLQKTMKTSGSFEISKKSQFREKSLQIQKKFSKSGQEIWSVTVVDYKTLFYITGATLVCEIYINAPTVRPTYEIVPGQVPQAK